MPRIKVTSKRQTTLPKELCEELRIEPGDSLQVDRALVDGEMVWCLRPIRDQESRPEWFGRLRKYAKGKSHDMETIRASIIQAMRDGRLDD